MNEENWLRCDDPKWMLSYLRRKVCDRKLRLFGCACVRDILADGATNPTILQAERCAEDAATKTDRRNLREQRTEPGLSLGQSDAWDAAWQAAEFAFWSTAMATTAASRSGGGRRRQADVLRHIVGNPFRPPPPLPHVPAAVRELAEGVYRQDQTAVGPLHDALLDAGWTELAEHFRDAADWHMKGCWLVDWLTGRT
jgi:hypothetical protein